MEFTASTITKLYIVIKTSSWPLQTCSDLVTQIGRGNETIFPASPFVYKEYEDYCVKKFGVEPKPHWAITNFGGQDGYSISLSMCVSV